MTTIRVASWALVVVALALWSVYNRRIALERRQRMLDERAQHPSTDPRQ
jgi:hypothetical protein